MTVQEIMGGSSAPINASKESESSRKNHKKIEVNVPVISLLGGPGSGKGTQCDMLVRRYNFTHISTGDLMRDEVKRNTKVGILAKQCMKEGRLVDSEVVLNVLKAKIVKELPTSPGFILDGFPRCIDQAKAFERTVCPISAYVYLKVADEVMLKRLIARGASSGRADDNAETAKNRISVFHDETRPIVVKYPQVLSQIDAEQSIDQVFSNVDDVFSKLISDGSRKII